MDDPTPPGVSSMRRVLPGCSSGLRQPVTAAHAERVRTKIDKQAANETAMQVGIAEHAPALDAAARAR